ncbi:MAG: hypothetical protein MUE40_11560 [Anaerolineae bacterium]|nr:hypothetical protein [Anaerolineae bacterium]
MSFTVEWYIPGRIIKVEVAGDMTLSTVATISQQLATLLDAGTAPLVHILIDVSRMAAYPSHLKEMQRASEPHLKHSRCGWILMYGVTSPLVTFVTNTIMQLAQVRTRTVSSEAAALAFLRDHDDSLRGIIETE